MRCVSPNCQTERTDGSKFCEFHRALFAQARAEIDAGKAARLKSPEGWGRKVPKICEALGCVTPAAPRESYCTYHANILTRRGT